MASSTTGVSPGSGGGLLALAGLVGSITFVGLILIGGQASDGYSHASQAISELSARGAEHAWLQTTNFLMMGLCVIAFAVALHIVARPPIIATLLVGLFGLLSSVAQATFPCDEGCEPETAVGTAHIVTGSVGFVAVIGAMLLLARHWSHDDQWRFHGRLTGALAITGLAGLAAFNITKGSGAESVDGLAQRAFALCVVIWLATTSVELYRRSRAQSHSGVAG